MSGGGGHIILSNTKTTLSDPLVHGALPANLLSLVDPILAKDPTLWTLADKKSLVKVYSWAFYNLP